MQIILETEQIHNAIARKLATAQSSITICVAWFTCKSLSYVVKDRLPKVRVNILISDHEFNHKASHFNLLLKYPNCKLYILPTLEKKLMHNKFCVIDDNWVITGSYNWSDKAETNYENILILENTEIAKEYNEYFYKLREKAELITDFRLYVKGFKTNNDLVLYEQETNLLAKMFENKIVENLEISRQYISIKFDKIEDMIRLHSGVGAARIYCNEPTLQSGLIQLRDKNHLELSFEWMVLQPEYSVLFSNATKVTARKKLIACRYAFPQYMLNRD